MAEIVFYHLTRSGIMQALPALLGRVMDSGKRAVVWRGDAALVRTLDDELWKISDPVWLPHASDGARHAELQPIWITAGADAPNAATFLFLLDGRELGEARFERVFDLFDGRDEPSVIAARQRWVAAKAAGHTLAYWRQGERGWTRAQ